MSWYGEQTYSARLSSEEAAALVTVGEAYWLEQDSSVSGGDALPSAVEFYGTYKTILESDAAGGADTPVDEAELRGIIFPWKYVSEFGFCPVSFVFKRSDVATATGETQWDLVTPRPLSKEFTAPRAGQDKHDFYWESRQPDSFGDWPWREHWPDERQLSTHFPVVFRFDAKVVLRKQSPAFLTLFLAAAISLLKIKLLASPDPFREIEGYSEGNLHFEEALTRAQRVRPERVAHWQQVFGLGVNS
jgi:hypothetical protein